MIVEVGSTVPIRLLIADGNIGMFPQAEVRNNIGALLTTLNLSHQASGVYIPSTPYLMPDELFLEVTYIVYTNVGHTIESTLYLSGIDIFQRIVPSTYKADISTLAIEANIQGHVTDGLTTQGYTVARASLLDNLDGTISSVLTAIGDLVDIDQAGIQAALTAQGYTTVRAVLLDYLDATISGIPVAVQLVLDGIHGSESWETATVSGLATEANATANRVAVVAEIDENEVKIDTIHGKTDTIDWTQIDLIFDGHGGRRVIDCVDNQEIFYKADNGTEVMRFNLFDKDGDPACVGIFERVRV